MTRRAWIIGNAPSLADLDMTLLKDEVTFSFNRAYIAYEDWGWYPTYYCAIDASIIWQARHDINDLIETSPIEKFYLNALASHGIVDDGRVQFLDFNDGDDYWGFNPACLKYAGDVAAFSIQIAYILGYHDLAIIGVDLDWGSRGKPKPGHDTDHFHPDYESERVRMTKPFEYGHLSSWRKAVCQATAEPYCMNFVTASPNENSNIRGLMDYVPFEELCRK